MLNRSYERRRETERDSSHKIQWKIAFEMTDTPQQIFVLFQQVLLASYIFIQYIIYIFIHKLRSSIDLRRTYTSHTHTHNVILPNLFSFIRYRLNFFRPIHRRVFVCKFLLYSRMTHSNFIQF